MFILRQTIKKEDDSEINNFKGYRNILYAIRHQDRHDFRVIDKLYYLSQKSLQYLKLIK